jgi:prepilin-type processing-associated H-X9-DG protein
MDDNLVGYLLKNLDPATHDRVESELRSDPELRQRLELVRQALAPLEEDREIQPSPDLAIKTLAFVAEHCCRELPRAPQPPTRSAPASTPRWRRADVAVAAGLLLAVVTLGFPMITRWRHQSGITECKNNLKQYYLAVSTYRDVHKAPPNINDKEPPRNVAGMIAPTLNEARILTDASICCPATKGFVACTTTLANISSMTNDEFKQAAPNLLPCYAYSLGYRDEQGVYHCAMEAQHEIASAQVPLMADRGPTSGTGNSINHGGYGQNVLFQDGHVEFVVSRNVGIDGSDIYLNREKKVAAGFGSKDVVLGPSASQP